MDNIRRFSQTVFKRPTPPPNLTKEMLIFWDGWSKKGDREVARESASKGSHINLALVFLAQRKGLPEQDTIAWFNNEILDWASDLLCNKQVHRASHILKNIDLNPITEITKTFLESSNMELRNFLGNHLEKEEQLSEELKQSWQLLHSLEEDYQSYYKLKEENGNIVLKFIHENSLEWKKNIAVKLFLKTNKLDIILQPLITSKDLWMNALLENNTELLCKWIDVQFSGNNNSNHESKGLLQTLLIDRDLVEVLFEDKDISNETKEKVFDSLSKYGIFNKHEEKDILRIIKRFTNTKSLHALEDILKKPSSYLDMQTFKTLFCNYCKENKLYAVLDICTKDFELEAGDCKEIELIKAHQLLAKNLNDVEILKSNLLITQNYINCGEFVNSLINFFILLLSGQKLGNSLWEKPEYENMKLLQKVLHKLMRNDIRKDLTMYDLLERHSKKHFLPSADSVEVEYKLKKLDCVFYVGQNRPSAATLEEIPSNIVNKINKLAIRNYFNEETVSSCIAFLEMIGIDSENLRIDIHIANASNGDFLNWEDKESMLNEYEIQICENIDFSSNEDIIIAIKNYNIPVKFAQSNNLDLPSLLPVKLAENNNWLLFLIHVQIYNYPQEQVGSLVYNFKDRILFEHLHHSLLNDIQYEPKSKLMKERDSRKYLLSKIGVRKNLENEMGSSILSQSSYQSILSQSSFGSTSSSGMSDSYESEPCDEKTDLLQILINCHNSSDPPKALLQACKFYKYPLLAVLATSYEPDSVITNWLTWLSVCSNLDVNLKFENIALVGQNVTQFLQSVVQTGFYKTLDNSFHIFLPDNPLKIFTSIFVDCISLNFTMETLVEKLENFDKSVKLKCNNSVVLDIDHDMLYLNSKIWIQNTVVALVAAALQSNFKTLYDKIQFLKLLQQIEFQKYFSVFLPDFTKFLQILEYLFQKKIKITIDFLNLFQETLYKPELEKIINVLVSDGKYDEALEIAITENIPADCILTEKWKISDDLNSCNLEFIKYNIAPENAVKFFTNNPNYEKLKLAYNWAYKNKLPNFLEVEENLWIAYLKSKDNLKIICDNNLNLSFSIKDTCQTCELSSDEKLKLGRVIDELLNVGDIEQAFRVAMIFGYTNDNLDIFRLCLNLADGSTLPFQLSVKERMLMNNRGAYKGLSHRKRTYLSTLISTTATVSQSPGGTSMGTILELESCNRDPVLQLIENLIEGLSSGMEFGQKILMSYRISLNIDTTYKSILGVTEPIDLLLEALNGDCNNKLEVVQDFISLYKWDKQEVSNFICLQLISSIQKCTNIELLSMWDLDLNVHMPVILQLLPDSCSILGNKLYSYASALYKSEIGIHDNPNLNELAHVIELLIRAHDCFTADCNMEGISVILKKCQTMITFFLSLKNWKFIVRLFIGIARYTEMNYVIHILRQNGQFENLLRKGKSTVNKHNGLKVALLEYLKKFCPENRDLYKMVALHFSLYSEVAQLWEFESESVVRNLIAVSKLEMQHRNVDIETCLLYELTNTDGTKLCINRAIENYTHAADYYLQGEKLAKAMHAAKQAELLALQKSLFKGLPNNRTVVCLLNLSEEQIASVIYTLSFPQTLILSEAYNYLVDWGIVLFKQVIISNQHDYLDNFVCVFNITEDLAYDISRRFLGSNVKDAAAIANMKKILKILDSVHIKYRIASELGFVDLVEEMLNGNQLIYLKDTVWKKGYKH